MKASEMSRLRTIVDENLGIYIVASVTIETHAPSHLEDKCHTTRDCAVEKLRGGGY